MKETDNTSKLIVVRQDMHAMAFNFFYDGWKYREPSEGYDAVAKDCNDAATRIVTEFEMLVKEHYEKNTSKEV